MNTGIIVSENVLTKVQDFTTEFLISEKKAIQRSVKEEGKTDYSSSTSMSSKYDDELVGNVEIHMDEKSFLLDMYVTATTDSDKSEVVFLSYKRAFGKSVLLMSTESQPKALAVNIETIPAIASLEKFLIELKH